MPPWRGCCPPAPPHRAIARCTTPCPPTDDRQASSDTSGFTGEGVGQHALRPDPARRVARRQLAASSWRCTARSRSATSRVGDLYVAADELALVGLQEACRSSPARRPACSATIALNREINRRDSEAYFRTLVLNAADVILIVDADNRITYASPSAQLVFGAGDAGRDRPVSTSSSPTSATAAAPPSTRSAAGARPADVARPVAGAARRRRAGAEVEVSIRDLRHEPTVAGLVLTLRDVTERRRLERELLSRAYLDPLTGLGNRLRFQDAVQRAANAAAGSRRDRGRPAHQHRRLPGRQRHDGPRGRRRAADRDRPAAGRRVWPATARWRGSGADEFGAVVEGAPDIAADRASGRRDDRPRSRSRSWSAAVW